ncbi:MAG TPA: hypothetical protein PLI27_02625 [Ignavibacteriales bacterium]|nr:hypothetical protein [Ignavibacteriales bacterium]HPD66958.1 hypothetical protein [Ignavibacteriales bacterium]HRR19342.1 hypothetical protein [Ignavibacteriales bacterium]
MLLFSFITTLVLIIFFLVKKTEKVKTEDEFLTAGKSLNTSQVSNVILGTIIGGASTIGTAQLAYKYGIVGAIYTVAAGIACFILGRFFAIPLRRSNSVTLSEFLGDYFGIHFQKYSSFFSIIAMIVQLVAQILSIMAVVLSIFHFNFFYTYLITLLMVIIFVIFGGILSSDLIGKIKIILIYTILLTSFVYIFIRSNYFADLVFRIPNFGKFFIGNIYSKNEIVFDFVSSVVGILSSQVYMQAIFSADSLRSARYGSYRSGMIIPIIGVLSVFIGLYMRAYFPDIISSLSIMPLFLLKTFPIWLTGVFFAGLVIIILGSCSGLILSLATNIYVDFIKEKNIKYLSELAKIRIMIVMILLSTIVILIFNPDTSILKFTYLSMGLRGAVYFVPVMLVIFNKNLVKLDNVKRIIYSLPIIYLLVIILIYK